MATQTFALLRLEFYVTQLFSIATDLWMTLHTGTEEEEMATSSSKISPKRPSTRATRRASHRLVPWGGLLVALLAGFYVTWMDEWSTDNQDYFLRSAAQARTANKNQEDSLFQLAASQSFGFFGNDISDASWRLLQQRALLAPQYRFPEYPERAFGVPLRWLIKNLQPVLNCPAAERIGGFVDVGAFWTCDPHRLISNTIPALPNSTASEPESEVARTFPCLVFCIGYSGFWEKDFAAKFPSCEVHIMDSSVAEPPQWSLAHSNLHWHDWELRKESGSASMESERTLQHSPTTLQAMRERLGHTNRPVDILKIDFDHAWSTYNDWIALNATQILWHLKGLPSPNEASIQHPAGPLKFSLVFRTLQEYGYIMFAKDHRLLGPRVALGYLRLHADFWKDAQQYAINVERV